MKVSKLFLGSLFVLSMVSCGDKEEDEVTADADKASGAATLVGSCSVAVGDYTMCLEYSDLVDPWLSSVEPACADSEGTWSTDACSTVDRVGVCAVAEDTEAETPAYSVSMYAPYTAETGAANCTNSMSGTFTADE